jgi:uncharacterized membrane protein YhaH (DUF805 family)
MITTLFPRELTRKQYRIRLLPILALVVLVTALWLLGLISSNALAAFRHLTLFIWIYAAFGLAVPRLRNAGKSPWAAILFVLPLLNIITAIALLFAAERPEQSTASNQSLQPTAGRLDA